jgi:DNA-binding IclR family transcriptional regulator
MDTPISVVGRIGAVLRAVSGSADPGATTSQVARATGIARPTAHRLLVSLAEEGLVDRDEAGRWLLGPELYLMGAVASRRYDVSETAEPFVRQLAVATGESAFFSAARGDETVCLLREEGSFPIRSHVLYEGIRFPLGVASAGLAILAYLPDREIEEYLARTDLAAAHGPAHTADRLWERIRATRSVGYAVNPGLIVEGSWGMGAAVFDAQGRPRWAVSITGIEQRFSPDRRDRMGERLLRIAHALTNALAR